jgi:hypothetical protein
LAGSLKTMLSVRLNVTALIVYNSDLNQDLKQKKREIFNIFVLLLA